MPTMHQYPEEQAHRTTRIVSVIAGTCVALACGSLYAYGAWAPNLGERLELSSTQVNIIGNFGNIGMYAVGIPTGLLIDNKGPRYGVALGFVLIACGYFPIHSAYVQGVGSMSVAALSCFNLLVGTGSCSAFNAAIKTSATNWPQHRGTATAFPLSAFGLSALFFTGIAELAFGDDTGALLMFLAIGTSSLVLVGGLFMRIVPPSSPYEAVPTEDGPPALVRRDSNKLIRRSHSRGASKGTSHEEIDGPVTESSSLVSSPTSSGPGDIAEALSKSESQRSSAHESTDMTGFALLRSPKFYQLFIMMGLLCGVGLMTINNIGNNARALWHHYDGKKSHGFIQRRQLMHVSIISFFSFIGRLCSGIGSDRLVHRGHSRFWTLVASACIFTIAQVCGMSIELPTMLFWLSGFTGLAYGALFGVYPSLVADAFGPSGLALNWGMMTLAPVVSGNVYNLAYGSILDSHSIFKDNGHGGTERICEDGRDCYASAYVITLVSSVVGICWSLWCIRHAHQQRIKDGREAVREHEG